VTPVLLVHSPGPLTTVQDLGRVGLRHYGVPVGGAFDRAAHRRANQLVGNRASAAALEITLGPFTAEALIDLVVAVTGTDASLRVGGRPAESHRAVRVGAGSRIELSVPGRGLRTSLAVRGGFAVEAVLGSRATDIRSGLGPPPVAAGDRLCVGDDTAGPPSEEADRPAAWGDAAALRVLPGPRIDRLPRGLAALGRVAWRVATASDRTGIRFEGEPLEIDRSGLPSEGMPPGAVQVPPSGLPILLGPDAGTTGGYPVVAVVAEADQDRAAQLRPGDTVTFVPGEAW
jgi:biotin-dependent carboxylase-like uncharacterized protein